MTRSSFSWIVVGVVVVFSPSIAFTQGTNSGATVTAPFVTTVPVIDGMVSDGEWASVGVAEGIWSAHDSDAAATLNTTVKVCYSVDAVYFLYECEDPLVQSSVTATEYLHGGPDVDGKQDSTFAWGGATDYVSLYIDPANIQDDVNNADVYSYSIQWEPSITAKNEADPNGNSYYYTESGRYGSFVHQFVPPIVDITGNTHYWGGGLTWQGKGIQIVDGPTSNGFVCEIRVPWASFSGYWRRYTEVGVLYQGDDWSVYVNSSTTDPRMGEYGWLKTLEIDGDGNGIPVGSGIVSGMPTVGTVWKVQFCRFSNGDLGYVNWVGDTGGFVSRPFGNLVFGEPSN